MLKVDVDLKESPGKGLGIFARDVILKGTLIWEFEFPDIKFSGSGLNFLDKHTQEFIKKYGWWEDGYICLAGDNDRFMNHSETPNTYSGEKTMYSKVDIQKGEEITCNYLEICDELKKNGLDF